MSRSDRSAVPGVVGTTVGSDIAPESRIGDPGTPLTMTRWLWFVYPLALIGMGAVWGAVLSALLGRQVAELVSDPRSDAGTLGLVVSVGAVVSLFAQPLMGRLSDITRVKILGRRNIWILFGTLAAVVALLATAFTTTLVLLAIVWGIAMVPLSAVQAALTAVLPERVPLSRRGRMSGVVGMCQVLGAFVGVALAGLSTTPSVGYISVAAFFLVTSTLFALTTKDAPAPGTLSMSFEEQREARKLPGLRAHPDFWWTFFGRFMIIFGYYAVSGFNLYLLSSYVHVGDGSVTAAGRALTQVAGISALALLVFAIVGGMLVDRFGKVRIFVTIASLLFVPAALVLWLVPTFNGFLLGSAIVGAAFGTYLAVDQVLITRVLPGRENAARDLGVMNIANAGPQVIAPALAGGLIVLTGSYPSLFVIMIVAVVIAAISVRFIKSVP